MDRWPLKKPSEACTFADVISIMLKTDVTLHRISRCIPVCWSTTQCFRSLGIGETAGRWSRAHPAAHPRLPYSLAGELEDPHRLPWTPPMTPDSQLGAGAGGLMTSESPYFTALLLHGWNWGSGGHRDLLRVALQVCLSNPLTLESPPGRGLGSLMV